MSILVVDDSPTALRAFASILKKSGFGNVITALSGEEAFSLLGMNGAPCKHRIDLIIMDIFMPGIDGVEACFRIKARPELNNIPIIMVTAKPAPGLLREAFEVGATDFLKKPPERVELAARVRSALRLKYETDRRRENQRALQRAHDLLEIRVKERTRDLSRINQNLKSEVDERRQTQLALKASESRLRTLLDKSPISIISLDSDGVVTFINDYHQRHFACGQETCEILVGRHFSDLPMIESAGIDTEVERIFEGQAMDLKDVFVPRFMDGNSGTMNIKGAPLMRGGQVNGAILISQDITQQKELLNQQQLSARVFENSLEGIIVADNKGVVQMVNPAFTLITGYAEHEVLGQEIDIFRADALDAKLHLDIWEEIQLVGQWSGEYWNRRKDGEAYPEWLTINLIKDNQGRVTNYAAIFHDITEIKRSQEKIRYQAQHDALTGLPNRVLFKDRLEQGIHSARRHNTQLAVLFIDLDNFKRVNDSLGHESGDLLLKEVGQRLAGCIRAEDTAARQGGDEFIVILNQVRGSEGAARVADKILSALTKPINIEGNDFRIGASIGITLYPDDGKDFKTLMKNADLAMYRAKEQGKNTYQLFTPSMNQQALVRLKMENDIRHGLELNEFKVFYQPKVEAQSGKIVGAEALARWDHHANGMVSPGLFVPVAEESGLILPLGEVVLKEACRQARHWHDLGFNQLTLSVNLSAKQFMQDDLVQAVAAILGETGLEAECLDLEITETIMMQNIKSAVQKARALTKMGVTFSVDDFGTGYSSLSYLKELPISNLKVDRSFVSEMLHNTSDSTIVQTIVSMAHAMNLGVVAEGVETKEQLAALCRLDCEVVQGYIYSRPLPAPEFEGLLHMGNYPPWDALIT
jgi:diguanylate cyclase (GGDEF)-like protein/PAS domain S-box-containing protein